NTMSGGEARRLSGRDVSDGMRRLDFPTLIMTGEEDDPCLEPGLLMKRTIPTAALVVFPNTGHAVNLEEPELFNRSCAEFFHQVESGRWPRRDPRSVTGSILGVRGVPGARIGAGMHSRRRGGVFHPRACGRLDVRGAGARVTRARRRSYAQH